MKHVVDLVGRLFISIIFFYEAYDTIHYFADTRVLLGEYGLGQAENFLIITGIILLVVGATLILVGYRVGLVVYIFADLYGSCNVIGLFILERP